MTAAAPRRARRALRGLSTALIVSGSLLLVDAGATLLWQEPVSAVFAHYQQSELGGELDRLEKVEVAP